MDTKLNRRKLLAGIGIGSAAALVGTGSAQAAPYLPEVVRGDGPFLHPEGVAWYRPRRRFLVGSLYRGTVSTVDRYGTTRTLADDGVMVSTVGLDVHHRYNRVYAAFRDDGVGERSTPETLNKQSGLGVFRGHDGKLLHRVDLTRLPGSTDGPHGANDVVVDPSGTAYVTDFVAGEIFRVAYNGEASLFLRAPDKLGSGFGPNGIVHHDDGYLLVGRYDEGRLWRIPVDDPESVSEVELDAPIVGADGLAWGRDGDLVAVRNDLASTGTPSAVTLRSEDGWRSARTVGLVEPWPDDAPTTAVSTPDGVYVVESRLRPFLQEGALHREFTLRRL
ncbi:gluconolaconase [Salininema proteolyticum]|uniref:Gluconolaconase n=1 Tax=Salininema proteolyticum TaxID=1607685 RepID=A0ABV8TVA5_9ACTN